MNVQRARAHLLRAQDILMPMQFGEGDPDGSPNYANLVIAIDFDGTLTAPKLGGRRTMQEIALNAWDSYNDDKNSFDLECLKSRLFRPERYPYRLDDLIEAIRFIKNKGAKCLVFTRNALEDVKGIITAVGLDMDVHEILPHTKSKTEHLSKLFRDRAVILFDDSDHEVVPAERHVTGIHVRPCQFTATTLLKGIQEYFDTKMSDDETFKLLSKRFELHEQSGSKSEKTD